MLCPGDRTLLPPECVDLFVDLFPPVCLCCGHPLPQVVDAAACRYQQLELRDHRPHLTRAELQFWMRPLQRNVEQLLERGKKSASEGMSGSCTDILAHRDALWTFASHEGVEPTNNHAELELRDFVLWRRRSLGTRSEWGDRFAERVMTVVRTARKQGLDVLDFLVRSITARVDNTTAPMLLAAAA